MKWTESVEGSSATGRPIFTNTFTGWPGCVKLAEAILVWFFETSRSVCERAPTSTHVEADRVIHETLEWNLIECRYALEDRGRLNLNLSPDLGPNEFQNLGLHAF